MKKLLAFIIGLIGFTTLYAADFYWVGNSGSWSDATHWASVSGGNGNAGIPTTSDNVFFDQHSFSLPNQTIQIANSAYCNNLTWKAATQASLQGTASSNLYVNGSLELSKQTKNKFKGTTYFTSTQVGNIINTKNIPFVGDVVIEGNGGEWELKGALIVPNNQLNLKAGTLNAVGNIISAKKLESTNGSTTLNIKSGTLLVQESTNVNASFQLLKNNQSVIQLKSNKNTNNTNQSLQKYFAKQQQAVIDSIVTDSTTCKDDCDGEARAFISGGIGPFSYVWPGCGTIGPTNILSDTCSILCVGTYILEVVDHGDGNSSSFQVFSINEPSPLAVFFSPSSPSASCFDTCDAQVTANTVGGNGGYTWEWSTGATTQQVTGLCAGTYFITVTDRKGCDTVRTITVSQPTELDPVATFTNVTCKFACDGTASTAPTGGSGNYTDFDWSNGATTQNINGLCPGIYTVTVTDDDGCIGIDSVTITEPLLELTLSKDSTNVSCGGACDGNGDVDVIGGTTPYTYNWSNGATTDSIFGLCANLYCVTVTDANGCQDSLCINITQPDTVFSNPTGQNITCNGDCDGEVTSNPTGGTSPFFYNWNTGCTTQTCTGLCPGTYSVTVTDANGCTHVDSVAITEPNILNGVLTTNDASCNGFCDGDATSTPSGGTTPYSWSWSTGATTSSISGLCAGTYTLTVTDANNCADTITFLIDQPLPLVANMDSTNITCNGDCDGTAIANPSGGTTPYSYTWLPGFETTQTITGLCPGTYTAVIVDANGCSEVDSVVIVEPLPLIVNPSGTNLSCNSICDGEVTANPTGGSTPYQYNWNTGCTTQTCTGLCAGTYTITVTDGNGCTEVDSITIIEPTAITANVTGNDPTCNGFCDGNVSANPVGGTGPYSYSWTGGCTTQNCNTLCSGQYFVTITDDNGCTTIDSITLVDPPILQLNGLATDVTCNSACDGTALVNPTGGISPYQFNWNTGATTSSINSLCPGTFTVTVTDANGCVNDTTFTIIEPLPITTTTIEDSASCDQVCDGQATVTANGGVTPYSYQWSSGHTTATADSLCTGQYEVTVTDANGCTALDTVTISALINLVINPTVVTIGCNDSCDGGLSASPSGGTSPYSYQWSSGHTTQSVDSVCAGMYFVTVTDDLGCFVIDSIQLTAIPQVFQVTDSVIQISCFGVCDGEAWANASGGDQPYTYDWNTSATTAGITGLCAGTYTVFVNDSNGCADTLMMTIIEPPALTLTTSSTDVQCNGACDGTGTATPGGGTSPYSYNWSNGATTQNINGLCPGTYTITVTDASGCTEIDSIAIVEPAAISQTSTVVNTTCFNSCDGSVNVVPAGGTAPYSYNWSSGCTTQTCTGLCAGTYTVTITDDNNCTITTTLIVNQPNELLANTAAVDVGCNNNCTGQVSAAPTGGTAPYSYNWDSGCTTQTCTGLCQGTYIVTVTDFNGCTVVDTAIVAQPSTLNLTFTSNNSTCNSECNGDATVTVTGGTTPYSFQWSNSQTTATATGLCAGTHTVTVTDQNGCVEVDTVVITEPNPIIANEDTVSATCGFCDGEVSVAPIGGVPPYTYQWNNGPTTASQTGICSGIYTVTITDFLGCDTIITIPVNDLGQPVGAVIATVDPTCSGDCDGTATGTPVGGAPPYLYQWNDVNNQTTQTATGLCAGAYILQITDNNGCNHFVNVILTDPSPIDASLLPADASCNGDCDGSIAANPTGGNSPYIYAWSTGGNASAISNLCAGTYTVTITDNDGCTLVDSATIGEPAAITAPISANDATCNGNCDGDASPVTAGGTTPYSYDWSDGQTDSTATGLCAGTYTVTITDLNGCTAAESVTISESTVIIDNPTVTESSCGNCDGAITVNPTGGSGTYNYTWQNPLPPNQTVNNLCAGVYDLTITDSNGCTETFSIPVSDSAGATINATGTNATCNGACDGTADVSILFGTGPFSFQWNDINNQTTQTATGLCAGTYFIEVTDGNGCVTIDTIVISDPSLIQGNLIVNDATCNGTCDGNITANPFGGVVPYSYNWSNAATTQSINGLCAGTYTVTISDAANCSAIETVVVGESNTLVPNIAGTDAQCNSICNGTATSNPTGGTAPYQYDWNTGATTQTIAALCAGTYTVTVTDLNGCTEEETVVIAEPSAIVANEVITDATCGLCDGVITLTPSGGTAPYNYNWGPGGQTTSSINNICAGVYDVTVTDDVGCSEVFIFIINNIGGPTATATGTDATCFGDCDGTANVVANGGTSPYTYSWNPAGETTTSVTGLCAGIYEVFVTDANNCIGIDTVEIEDSDPIVANFLGTDASCTGDCDGTGTANPTGGTSPYSYQWDANAGNQTTQTATGLCAGSFSVTITDANGCTLEDVITINEPTPIAVNDSSDNGNCNGSCDGIAFVDPTNGTAPYSYNWSTGATTQSITDLCQGNYTVTITDDNGCTATATVVIGEPTVLTTSISGIDASCNSVCDGSATSTPLGGTAPYSYNWFTSGQTTQTATGLCAGLHYVVVTDSNGCQTTDSIIIGQPAGIVLDSTAIVEATCGNTDGQITVFISGGDPGYTYQWDSNANNQTDSVATGLGAGLYSITVTDNSGCTNVFSIPLSDSNGPNVTLTVTGASCDGSCTGTAFAVVTGGTSPYTYNWNNGDSGTTADSLCPGQISLIVTDDLGCTTVIADTIDSSTIDLTPIIVQPSCPGDCDGAATAVATGAFPPFTYQWGAGANNQTTPTATGLCAGSYSVTVTDSSGCEGVLDVIITNPDTLQISLDTAIAATCINTNEGEIQITVTGGTTPYSYDWNGPNGYTNNIEDITTLLPGDYTIIVTDSSGCTDTLLATVDTANILIAMCSGDTTVCEGNLTDSIELTGTYIGTGNIILGWYDGNFTQLSTDTFVRVLPSGAGTFNFYFLVDDGTCVDTCTATITIAPPPAVDAGLDQSIIAGNSTEIGGEPTGPVGAGYSWSPFEGLSDTSAANPTASPEITTTYAVIVSDSSGCTASDSVTVIVIPQISFPNGFSPNADGTNDVWVIDFIDQYPNAEVEVYNRWGEMLFYSKGYTTPWDGKYNGNDLPVGTYYYVIELNHEEAQEPFTGPVTIMR